MIHKWQMSRVGLINFWYYQDQVYEFSNGKLLLRGSNGSGKSVTMQSLLPVLLDGITISSRLDSFGSSARKMEDYLLGEQEVSKKEEATGYLYLEFKKTGIEEYLTVGIGLSARRNNSLQKWYFSLTDNSRIGKDFFLYEAIGNGKMQPFSKKQLQNRLENRGKLFENQQAYQEYINQKIFGFDTIDQFNELIKLLINLRSPKLSRDFKPTVIYDILKDSLPQLSEDDLQPLASTIEQIDMNREQLEQRKFEKKELSKLIKSYQAYREEMIGQIAQNWLVNEKMLADIDKQIQESMSIITDKSASIVQKNLERDELETKRGLIESETIQLSSSEGFNLVAKAEDLRKTISAEKQRFGRINGNAKSKESQVEDQKKKQEHSELSVTKVEKTYQEILENSRQYLETLNLTLLHDEMVKKIKTTADATFYKYWLSEITNKMDLYKAIIYDFERMKLLTEQRQIADRDYSKALQKNDAAHMNLKHWTGYFNDELELWKTDLSVWREKATLKISSESYGETLAKIENLPDNWLRVDEVLATIYAEASDNQTAVQESIYPLNAKLSSLTSAIHQKELEITEWQNQKELIPFRSETRQKNRAKLKEQNANVISFYNAVDFKQGVDEPTRNALEGAIVTSGLIDALLTKEAVILDGDIKFLPDPQLFHLTLADYLIVSPGAPKAYQELIQDVLETVLVNEPEQTQNPQINTDGSFYLANLIGKSETDYQASLIGEASRARHRKLKVDELTTQIAKLTDEVLTTKRLLTIEKERLTTFSLEIATLPRGEDVYEAFEEQKKAESVVELTKQVLVEKEENLNIAKQKCVEQQVMLKEKTKSERIGFDLPSYQNAFQDTDNYAEAVRETKELTTQWWEKQKYLVDIQNTLQVYEEDLSQLREELAESQSFITRSTFELERNLAEQAAQDVTDLSQRLSDLTQEKNAIITCFSTLTSEINALTGDVERSKQRLEEAQAKLKDIQPTTVKWQYIFESEIHRYGKQNGDIIQLAKQVKREGDIDQLKKYENSLDNYFNYAKEQLRDYSPRLSFHTVIDKSEIKENQLNQLWMTFNNQRILTFDFIGSTHTPFELSELLQDQISKGDELLKESDEKIFKQIIFDSVGKVLRALIENSLSWVKKMNDILKERENPNGLALMLKWKELKQESEGEIGTKELVRLLRKDAVTLSAEDIETIQRHFQAKINSAKLLLSFEEEGTDSLFTALKKVLDYRNWFEFELYYKRPNEGYEFKVLNNTKFNQFSGGEKAVSMYLPLFTSVYSRYLDANEIAPYIMTLDEAFAGIDEQNISDLFLICESLNFNYIMNSQALYGDYPAVTNLNTYELIRPQNADIVSTVKYYWNGKKKIMLPGEE